MKVRGDREPMTPSERHHRLTQIFIAVCNLDDEERRKVLDRECRDCPEFRNEIELLLSFHDSVTRPSPRFHRPPKSSLS